MRLAKMYTIEEAFELRKKYKAVDTIWHFVQHNNKELRETKRYKMAAALAPQYGIDVSLYDDVLKNWSAISKSIKRISLGLKEEGVDANVIEKLRLLNNLACWPYAFHSLVDSIFFTQCWKFTDPPQDSELLPIELQVEKNRYGLPDNEDWLEENFFTNPWGPIRAVVYTEDDDCEYNFQNIPAAKKYLEIIKETATQWREAARATDFDFDKEPPDLQGLEEEEAEQRWGEYREFLKECPAIAWNAAPEALRNEHIKAVRQLVKIVWQHHQKQLTPYTGSQSKPNFPTETISPNDKITNTIFDGDLKLGEGAMIAHTKTPKKSSVEPIMSKVEINYKAIEDCVSLVQQDWDAFTDYDRSIYNACVSLYLIGNKFVTPQTIYRVCCGKQTAMATPKNIERIINSIDKLRSTNIKINADDVVHLYNKNIKKWEIDTTLLEARKHNALSIQGKSASGYELLAAPPLFVFADAIGQVIRTPISIQATPVTKTEGAVKMQEYLKNRIAAMGGGKVKRVIRYKSIFDKIEWMGETEGGTRNKKAKIREQVRSILDYWVQENYIASYTENRRGKEFYSIEIFLPLSKAN